MCGIVACFCADKKLGTPIDRESFVKTTQTLAHRGPDWLGIHISEDGKSAVGHTRLSIVDPASGRQPIREEKRKLTLGVNGEIYNHRAILDELRKKEKAEGAAYEPKSKSDCEAIMALYCSGADVRELCSRLDGMFAFVLLDEGRGRMVVARDPLGICPLYYGKKTLPEEEGGGSRYYFASELKAIERECGDGGELWEFPPGHVFVFEDPARCALGRTISDGSRVAFGDSTLRDSPDSSSGPRPDAPIRGDMVLSVSDATRRALLDMVGATGPRPDALVEGDMVPKGPDGRMDDIAVQEIRYYEPRWLTHPEDIPTAIPSHSRLAELLVAAVKKRMMCDVPHGVLLSGGLDSTLTATIDAHYSRERIEDDGGGEAEEAHFPHLHSFAIGLEGSPDLAAARRVADRIGTVHHEIHFTPREAMDALPEVVRSIETYDVTTIRASTPMYLLAKYVKSFGIKMVLSGEGADEIFAGYLYNHRAPSKAALHVEACEKLRHLHHYDLARGNKSMMAAGVELRVPFLDRDVIEYGMGMDPFFKMPRPRKEDEPKQPSVADGGPPLSAWREDDNGIPSRRSPETDSSRVRQIEKRFLREAFDQHDITRDKVPKDILWRQKEQFSDGVGYGHIDALRALADEKVTDAELASAAERFPINTPDTKEAYMYRAIFAEHFPSDAAARTVRYEPSVACSTAAALKWDADFQSKGHDPSGRRIGGVHDKAWEE